MLTELDISTMVRALMVGLDCVSCSILRSRYGVDTASVILTSAASVAVVYRTNVRLFD